MNNNVDNPVRFERPNCYSPNHHYCKNWVFTYTSKQEDELAYNEAALAHHFCVVAEQNGLTNNEAMYAFPLLLRMLKSKSEWAK